MIPIDRESTLKVGHTRTAIPATGRKISNSHAYHVPAPIHTRALAFTRIIIHQPDTTRQTDFAFWYVGVPV